MLSHLICVQLFVIPWTVALQAPPSTGIFQTRILKWVAMPSSKGSSQPTDQTQVLRHCRGILYCLSHQGSPRAGLGPQQKWK